MWPHQAYAQPQFDFATLCISSDQMNLMKLFDLLLVRIRSGAWSRIAVRIRRSRRSFTAIDRRVIWCNTVFHTCCIKVHCNRRLDLHAFWRKFGCYCACSVTRRNTTSCAFVSANISRFHTLHPNSFRRAFPLVLVMILRVCRVTYVL